MCSTAEETTTHYPGSMVVSISHRPVATPSIIVGGAMNPVTVSAASDSNDVFRRLQDGSTVAINSPSGVDISSIGVFKGDGVDESNNGVLIQNQNGKSELVKYQNLNLDSPLEPMPECGRQSQGSGQGSCISKTGGVSYSQECTEVRNGRGTIG